MIFSSKKIFAAAILLCAGFSFSGIAASTNVTVGSPIDRFTPTNVTINTGDQVIWDWVASNHSSTSGTNGVASGLWGSGVLAAGKHFTNSFPSAGSFSYYCSVHFNLGMTGSVIVVSVSLPPTLAITNPAVNALFIAPANVTIQATVTNGSSAVTNVQFRIGSTILTNVPASPFSATTNNLSAGSYTLTSLATDNHGLTATNSSKVFVV